jgi:hypothetical protein
MGVQEYVIQNAARYCGWYARGALRNHGFFYDTRLDIECLSW